MVIKMTYKIGYVSKISGVSPRTLGFYEQKGLLIPKKDIYTNYRYYDDEAIDKLQQILIYKALGFTLDEIYKVLTSTKVSNLVSILEVHLLKLKQKKDKLSTIIHTVEQTISMKKGEITMSNKEKFEGFKEKLINDNDENYKDEVIKNYGKESYERSKKAFKHMTEDQYNHMNQLNVDLFVALKNYKLDPSNELLAQNIFNLHKAWITFAWGSYDKNKHRGVADLYIQDERFMKYYDKDTPGLAKLLHSIIHKFTS